MNRFFQKKEIPIQNILSATTDGSPAMTGRHKGFISHLKQAVYYTSINMDNLIFAVSKFYNIFLKV